MRTLRSTLPVAITHLMPAFDRSSSFFFITPLVVGVPLTSPLVSPFTVSSLIALGAHRIQLTKWPCASSTVFTHLPSCVRSQHRIVLSSLALSRYLPPGWKTRPRTQL